jgi:hypothetical protein
MTSAGSDAAEARGRVRTLGGQRRRYGLLLAVIVTVFAIQGVATPEDWEQVLVTAILGVTLLLSLQVADAKRSVRRFAMVLALTTLVLSIVEAVNGNIDHGSTRVANGALVLLAPPAIAAGVVRSLRARRTVTLEAVLGVLSVYLLLGMLFAYVYGAIDRLGGGPFFAQEVAATVSRCLYFSFTTLTTVGYGDYTARSSLGHTLAVSEALFGQIYLVTIVSLIVANLGRSRGTPRSESP